MVWIKRGLAGIAGLLVLALLATTATGATFARRSVPTTDAELALPGLDAPVEVLRDEHGVPTIVASSSNDLFRAQGFVHAQDRFWEMDFRRHVTAGRLSELFGESQLDTDRFVRTLGWRRVAEAELELLAPETTRMLEAYAEGVNAWTEGRTGSQLSLEHALLPLSGPSGYVPEPWTPADSVAWLKAMAWDLRSNLEDELLRARLLGVDLGEGRGWQELFPTFPADRHPPILPEGGEVIDGRFVPGTGLDDPEEAPVASPAMALDRALDVTDPAVDAALAAAQQALADAPMLLGDGREDGIGSNSWVVAPERSATGSALLANDPHLGPAQPSLWYQVGLRCEPVGDACPYHVLGYSFAGMPGIVIGQTDRIAWGFTNLGPDVADLAIERIDGDRVQTEDGWEPLEVLTETVGVAGGDDVELTIRIGPNGPLFSDVSDAGAEVAAGPLAGADDAAGGEETGAQDGGPDAEVEHAVALRWVALDPVATADAVPLFMQARDWDSFRAAASRFEVPSQSLVYADVDGHIGYQAPGRIPVRRSGDGTLPQPGWTGEATWERFLDFEELPWTFDPAEGMLATANQPVLAPGSEPFLSRDFNLGYRAARITELLDGRDDLSLDDLLAIQLDAHNGNAANLVPTLLAVPADGGDDSGASADVEVVQEVLATWDLQDAADSAGAAAFNATWRHLLAATFHDELPEWAWPTGSARWWEIVRGLVTEPDAAWWDDLTTPERETRDDVLRQAMADAHAELADRFSPDPTDWRWGAMHTLTLTHATFGSSGIAPLEALFNRGPLQLAGGSDIVNATGWSANEGYEVNWVPSMRYLVDLGDLDAGRWIHLTGQSGRPFHQHYADQAEAWARGDTLPIHFTPAAVEAAAVDQLTLLPDEG
ncbi:MAG: penicillin acylase family protein [Nitriliruptoraceae bacterium]